MERIEIASSYVKDWIDYWELFKKSPFPVFVVMLLLLSIFFIKWLIETFPQLEKIYGRICGFFWFSKCKKAAIKHEIQGSVNKVVGKLQNELPNGWFNRMSIDWVRKETENNFLENNIPVIRMRPLEDNRKNFTTATYLFLKKTVFPKTKDALPVAAKEAVLFYLGRRILESSNNDVRDEFDERIVEHGIKKHKKIPEYMEAYDTLDSRGFFTSTFIREIDEIAKRVRFTKKRKNIGHEIQEIIKHVQEFIVLYDDDEHAIPEGTWHRAGTATYYGFMLVANPSKTKSGVQQYLNRTQRHYEQGETRLYLFGTKEEDSFAHNVIRAIDENSKEWEFDSIFDLYRDYRGNKGGVGALFIRADKQ